LQNLESYIKHPQAPEKGTTIGNPIQKISVSKEEFCKECLQITNDKRTLALFMVLIEAVQFFVRRLVNGPVQLLLFSPSSRTDGDRMQRRAALLLPDQ
jgi:hypothetical protein